MKKRRRLKIILSISFIIFISYMVWGNATMTTSYYQIIDSNIPTEFSNFKIIQISDFHNIKTKKSLIKKIKNEEPNVIFITGDLIDSYNTNIDKAIVLIESLKDIAPIYYVTGNHESRKEEYLELKRKLQELEVIVLNDEITQLRHNEAIIELVGINDPNIDINDYKDDKTKVNDVLKALNLDSDSYKILLSHRPELFDVYSNYNIDLVFSGHAHGGQFVFPLIGGIYAPNQGLFPKYTNGLYEKNNTSMIVSRGLGNSIIPIRFNNRAELVVVTLNKE